MGGFVTIYNYVGYRLVSAPFSLSQTEMGFIFSVYLFGVVSSAWVGSLSVQIGRRNLLPVTLGMMLAGTALTSINSLWIIVVGIAVLTVGFFGTHSVASAWVGARAQTDKAQASSLYLFAYYLGSSVVGSLGGVFWNRARWPGVAEMTIVLLLIAIVLAFRLRRWPVIDSQNRVI